MKSRKTTRILGVLLILLLSPLGYLVNKSNYTTRDLVRDVSHLFVKKSNNSKTHTTGSTENIVHQKELADTERIPTEDLTPLDWVESEAPNYYKVLGKSNLQSEAFPNVQKVTTAEWASSFKGGKASNSSKKIEVSYPIYGELDNLRRSTGVLATVTPDMVKFSEGWRTPWEGSVEPSGWFTYKFKKTGEPATEFDYLNNSKAVSRKSNNGEVRIPINKTVYKGQLYNRDHLFADRLGGRGIRENLTTGTRPHNVGDNKAEKGGMAYLEEKVDDYVSTHKVYAYYKSIPVYVGDELVPRGTYVKALTSDGAIDETVYVYNVAKGYTINYADGTWTKNN